MRVASSIRSTRLGIVTSAVGFIALLIGAYPAPLYAGPSIFDDDWKPVTRPVSPPEVVPDPPIATPRDKPIVAPAPPATPAVVPLNFKPATGPRPIPDGQQLTATRKLFRELFVKELGDASTTARRALAAKLLEEAAKCSDKPADQYVLLTAAHQAALDAKDLPLSFSMVDVLAAAFEVDAQAIKARAAVSGGLKAETPMATWDNCLAALRVYDELVETADYDVAAKLAVQLSQSVAGDPFLKTAVAKRGKDLDALRISKEKFVKAAVRLKAVPDDPAARQDAGVFLCFCKGDWERGLPMLSRGTQVEMKSLAATELAGMNKPEMVQQAAAGWAAVAVKQPEVFRSRIQEHATALYRKVLAESEGLQRRAIELAIQKLQSSATPRWIDLLPLVQPELDVVHGKWSRDGCVLFTEGQSGRLELPYTPPAEYAFRIDFTVRAGQETVFMGIAKEGKAFQWIMGNIGNRFAGFQLVDGQDAGKNKATVKQQLELGRRYVTIVEVYRDKLKVYVDGRLLMEWPTDFHELSHHPHANWAPREPSRLAVGSWSTPVVFHRIEVLELAGSGVLLR
jgi:hypothetical protein